MKNLVLFAIAYFCGIMNLSALDTAQKDNSLSTYKAPWIKGISSHGNGETPASILLNGEQSYTLPSYTSNGISLYEGTPMDMTTHIANPDYSEGKTGWEDTNSDWSAQYQVAEHYGETFDHYQVIEGIPNGLYRLTVQGFIKQSPFISKPEAVFYAATGDDSITKPVHDIRTEATAEPLHERCEKTAQGYIPASMNAAHAYFKEGIYISEYHITVENQRLRIGIALPECSSNDDWVVWSNWKLYYYGMEAEEYAKGVINRLVNCNLERFDTISANMTKGTVEAYKQDLSRIITMDITDINECEKAIEDAIDAVETNIEAWETFTKKVKEIKRSMDDAYEQMFWNDNSRNLYDYIQTEAPAYINQLELTTEELLSQIYSLKTMESTVFLKGEPKKNVWSYVSFEEYEDESGEMKEKNSYTRYLLDRGKWTNIGQISYYKLLEYNTCEYEEGKETNAYRIRWEDKRIYIHKEDAPDYAGYGILLKEEGDDYILYDFNLNVGDEFCKYVRDEEDTLSITVSEISSVTTVDGQTFKTMRLGMGHNWWIEGIGSATSFLYYIFPESPTCICGSSLNYAYEATIHDIVFAYKNPFGNIAATSTAFKSDDCALGADAIEEIIKGQKNAQIQVIGQALTCTSPTAMKLEIYTMDAVKVGEARFTNGEATVTVSKVPATYLYIVTYPDGRRESGKVMK